MERYIRVAIVERTSDNELRVEIVDDYKDELSNYYNTIGCRAIDIITRKIKGHCVDFVIDDEYLLTDKAKEAPTGICSTSPMLEQIYGTFVITGTGDEDGNLTDLSVKDVSRIADSITIATRVNKDTKETTRFDVLAYQL